jgi:uncharacterized protein (TIGR00369 family)
MAEPPSEDLVELIRATATDGWATAMGLRLVRATRDEVIAEVEIQPCHLQAFGIVHGGVYSGIIESLASIGAAIHALHDGKVVVGLENHTSFVRAVRSGKLRAVSKPLVRGRRSHVWECSIEDESERLVATGRVRLLIVEPGSTPGG